MRSQLTVNIFVMLVLLALWSRTVGANALVANLKSFTAGGVGGVLSVLVGHPLDLVKVRMQTGKAKEGQKQATFAHLRQIVRREGVGGLYRGVGAPIVAVAPIWATSFWGFDTGIKLVRAICNLGPEVALTLPQLCIAGGFSALPTCIVMVPSERVKCILQMQDSTNKAKKQYMGMMDCANQLYKTSGIPGLYKGTALTLLRDIPANIVYFGVYQVAKECLTARAGSLGDPSPLVALAAGALAGVAFWPVALPMDTLKSRYQTAEDGKYKNLGDVYDEVIKEDGVGGLFNGMGPAMIRSAPANAVSFLGAEITKKCLSFLG